MLLTKWIFVRAPRLCVCLVVEGVRTAVEGTPHANQMNPSSLSMLFLVRLIWPASWTSFYSPGPPRVGKASHGERERERERKIGFSFAMFMPVMRWYFISCLLILEFKWIFILVLSLSLLLCLTAINETEVWVVIIAVHLRNVSNIVEGLSN